MPATPPWLAAAEAMFNRNVDASSQASLLAQRLNGSSLQIEAQGLARIRCAMHGGRMSLLSGEEESGASALAASALAASAPASSAPRADATIAGSPSALLSLLRSGSAARGSVQIRGDAEIANLYKEFFAAARPDFEEELSRWIGDLPARNVARAARGLGEWFKRTRRIAGENIAEYLQEEGRDLPSRTEADEYLQGVDEAREAADRLEARIRRLEQRTRDRS